MIALLPKLTGTVAEKDPSAAAVVLVTDGRRPRSWCRPTRRSPTPPRAVFPVTVVDVDGQRAAPTAGAVIVTGSAPGGPWVT